MQLGFVSAILADQSLEQVLAFAADEGFSCVELMCWPPGRADRRYAGVTHLDVTDFTDETAAGIQDLLRIHRVNISALVTTRTHSTGIRTPDARVRSPD